MSGTSSSGSGGNYSANASQSAGQSSSKSAPQLTPAQLVQYYNQYLPSMLNTASGTVAGSPAAPALNAANQGAVAGVNAINLNGLSPGEANAIQRSTNQTNFATGNLGNNNATNTISNAMNFGGAFNSKIPLLNASTNAATGAAGAGTSALGTASTAFNPVASLAAAPISTSSSGFGSSSLGVGQGNNTSSGISGGLCFLTTACCQYKGLPDDCEELQVLRKFRDTKVSKKLIQQYYRIAPKIVKKINGDARILQYIWDVVQMCMAAIRAGEDDKAIQYYTTMVTKLKKL